MCVCQKMRFIVEKWTLSSLYASQPDQHSDNQQTDIDHRINEGSLIFAQSNHYASRTPMSEPDRTTALMQQQQREFLDNLAEEWRQLAQMYIESEDGDMRLTETNDAVLNLIKELNALGTYLSGEEKLMDSVETFSQSLDVDSYATNLNKRLLQLTQSTQLWRDQCNCFYDIVKDLELKKHFTKIEFSTKYEIDELKSKIKLKMQEYEKCAKKWNEYELALYKIERILFKDFDETNINIKHLERIAEINDNINLMITHFGDFAPLCNEYAFTRIKQEILINSLKLKKLKDTLKKQEEQSKSKSLCESCQQSQGAHIHHMHRIDSNNNSLREVKKVSKSTLTKSHHFINATPTKRKVETADKCSATVHEMSTQTTDTYQEYFSHSHNNATKLTYAESNNSKESLNNGKEFLLKAYLNNQKELTIETNTKADSMGHKLTATPSTTTGPESGMYTHSLDDDLDEMIMGLNRTSESMEAVPRLRIAKKSPTEHLEIPSPIDEEALKPIAFSSPQAETRRSAKNEFKAATKAENRPPKRSFAFPAEKINIRLIYLVFFFFILLSCLLSYFYKIFFSPVCCDHKRDYLFINMIT